MSNLFNGYRSSIQVWLIRFLLSCAVVLPAAASQIHGKAVTAPAQPTTGPGGSSYPYASVAQFGPYYEGTSTAHWAEFVIFQPSPPATTSLPVVLFLHGDLLNKESEPYADEPVNYQAWIDHVVRKGYTVVYPFYDANVSPTQFTDTILGAWTTALSLLASKRDGMLPPSTDADGIQTLFAGHSMGSYEAFAVAQSLYQTGSIAVPPPRAIAGFNPGIGQTGLPLDFTSIDPSTSVVLVKSDQEDIEELNTADTIWAQLEEQIPASNRDYLEVNTDEHGTPAQLGNHCWPLTNGLDDDTTVDDRDYRVSYKLTVGLFDCVLHQRFCTYGLGHGGTDQVSMGKWSDGTAVAPLSWISSGN